MWRPVFFLSYLPQFFFKWEKLQTKYVEKIKTHILCSNAFSRKSYRLWNNVGKYGTARQAIYENVAHAHCMLAT
jgi:hypothetical protein